MLTDENTKDSDVTDEISSTIKLLIESPIEFSNEINTYEAPDLMPGSVGDKAKAKKKMMKILLSREDMPIMIRDRPKKKIALVDRLMLLVKILKWKKPVWKSKSLILLSLAKQDFELYIDPDIWFKPVKDLKAYYLSIMQQQQISVNGIVIPKSYKEVMASPQRDKWMAAMKFEINNIK